MAGGTRVALPACESFRNTNAVIATRPWAGGSNPSVRKSGGMDCFVGFASS